MLKGAHGQLIRVPVLECDDFEDCDVRSQVRRHTVTDVIDDVTNRRAVGTFLYTTTYWARTPKSLKFTRNFASNLRTQTRRLTIRVA